MELIHEAVAEVANYKADAEDNTAEEVNTDEEEDMMVVVDAEADMADVVGMIQITGGADLMQEWYSAMMAH